MSEQYKNNPPKPEELSGSSPEEPVFDSEIEGTSEGTPYGDFHDVTHPGAAAIAYTKDEVAALAAERTARLEKGVPVGDTTEERDAAEARLQHLREPEP